MAWGMSGGYKCPNCGAEWGAYTHWYYDPSEGKVTNEYAVIEPEWHEDGCQKAKEV